LLPVVVYSFRKEAPSMTNVTAEQVASYFVWRCNTSGESITNLKLQKLLYYAQGWHLALCDRPLFSDLIRAWVHGPVVKPVYTKYREFGGCPITTAVREPSIPGSVKKHLDDILNSYSHLSAFQLEQLTHTEQPWCDARMGYAPDDISEEIIDNSSMKTFFKSKLRGKK
jgi:uncharacterized phage-associated protein